MLSARSLALNRRCTRTGRGPSTPGHRQSSVLCRRGAHRARGKGRCVVDSGETQRLTARQAAIMEAIAKSIRERGYPPTIREIGAAVGIKSTNGVNDHLDSLERKGMIRRSRIVSRGITITAQRDDSHERALLAEVARCAPVEAVRAALDALVRKAAA